MKKFLLSIFCCLMAVFAAQADEYSYTFESKVIKANGAVALGDVEWTFAGSSTYFGGVNATKGQQLGSGSNPNTSMSLSTSGIEGTVSRIVINTSGANNIEATIQVTVGGEAFGVGQTISATATDYTFEGEASGEIEISYTQTSSVAIYIKSITVTYAAEGEEIVTVSTPTITESCEFNEGDEVAVEITNNAGVGTTVWYTTDGENYVEYTGSFSVNETTTVKAYAQDGADNKSATVSATYTMIYAPVEGTVATAFEKYVDGAKKTATITGYIVGYGGGYSTEDFVLSGETTVYSNVLIADDANETDITKCIPVQLSSGKKERTALNLVDNPANYKQKITVTGSLETYFNQAGIKTLSSAAVYYTVSNVGYATLYLGYDAVIPETVNAYVVSSLTLTHALLTEVEGSIPAGTGIILEGEGEHKFVVTSNAPDVEANELKGSVKAETITPADNTTYYILAVAGGEVGLYPDAVEGGTFQNNANKAYLPVASENAAAGYSFVFDWAGTTGVEGVVAEGAQNGKIYDITGREVKAITVPGIYIINGKKVVK